MMGAMNFNAYSARVAHWFNPDAYAHVGEKMNDILNNSHAEIAGARQTEEDIEQRAMIEEKIAAQNPEMVYSRFRKFAFQCAFAVSRKSFIFGSATRKSYRNSAPCKKYSAH